MVYARRTKRKTANKKAKAKGGFNRQSFVSAPAARRSKPAARKRSSNAGSGRAITIRVVQQAAAPISPIQSLMMDRLQKLVERKVPKASKF